MLCGAPPQGPRHGPVRNYALRYSQHKHAEECVESGEWLMNSSEPRRHSGSTDRTGAGCSVDTLARTPTKVATPVTCSASIGGMGQGRAGWLERMPLAAPLLRSGCIPVSHFLPLPSLPPSLFPNINFGAIVPQRGTRALRNNPRKRRHGERHRGILDCDASTRSLLAGRDLCGALLDRHLLLAVLVALGIAVFQLRGVHVARLKIVVEAESAC